jgi:hypothetical protein
MREENSPGAEEAVLKSGAQTVLPALDAEGASAPGVFKSTSSTLPSLQSTRLPFV